MEHPTLITLVKLFSFTFEMFKEGFGYEIYPEQENNLMKYTSDFVDVVTDAKFVDKSLMLKTIMEDEKNLLITTPNLFGKKLNMNMLKNFFSIPLNAEERNKTLQVFRSLKIYKEHPDFVESHFGKFPVVHLNFQIPQRMLFFSDIYKEFCVMVEQALRRHSYMKLGTILTNIEREKFTRWCDGGEIYMTRFEINEALVNLVQFLHKHHGTPVFLIIHDFDSILTRIRFWSAGGNANSIISFISEQISKLVNLQNDLVKVVMTGVSSVTGRNYLHGFKHCRFLGDHEYTRFFGFTQEEMRLLMSRNHVTMDLDLIRQWYGGYKTHKGLELFNPVSVYNFLVARNLSSYWVFDSADFRARMYELLKIEVHMDNVFTLFRGDAIQFKFEEAFPLLNIKKILIDLEEKLLEQDSFLKIFLTYLFENGYLTWVGTGRVRLPNMEVQEEIYRVLTEILKSKESPHRLKLESLFKEYHGALKFKLP